MNKRDQSILRVTCYGHFLSHFNMLVFPAILLPLSGRFQMDIATTLDLAFWMYLLFGITALPWGILADRFGGRNLLWIFHIGAGCCGLLAAYTLDQPFGLKIALAGIGLFSGIYHPAGLGWIARSVSKTSTGMAYNGMFGNLGLATGPLCAGLVNWQFGPRSVYLMLGIANLVGVVFLLKSAANDRHAASLHQKKSNNVASWRRFIILLVVMMLGGLVYRGTTITLPALFELKGGGLYDILVNVFGGGLSQNVLATALVSCLYLVGVLGQYTGGRVGEMFDLRWSYFIFHLITIPAAFIMYTMSNIPLIIIATIHSFFLLGMQPIENTLVARLTPPNLHHTAFGMKFVVTFGIGAMAVKIVQLVKSGWSLSAVYPVLGIVSCILVAVIGILIVNTPRMRA